MLYTLKPYVMYVVCTPTHEHHLYHLRPGFGGPNGASVSTHGTGVTPESYGNAVHTVHTQCVQILNPNSGPLGAHLMRHARGVCSARRFGLVAHPSTHRSYPGGPTSRDFRLDL